MNPLRLSAFSLLSLVCLALCLPAHLAQAQLLKPPSVAPQTKPRGSETLGSINFMPPSGWKRKATPEFVSFETTDSKQGRWAILGVYRDRPGTGNAGQDFASQWQQIVGAQFSAPMPSEIDTSQHPAGYEIKVGGTQVQSEMGGAVAILAVASGHGVAISTLFLTNHNDYVPQLDRFMQGVSLDKPKPGSAAQRTPAAGSAGASVSVPSPAPAVAGGPRPAHLVGTWVRGSVGGPALYDRATGNFATYASGSGGQLELRANGTASWARVMRNNAGCGMTVATFREGHWSAGANKVSFKWTGGDNDFITCGKSKRSKPSVSTEDWSFETHDFQGSPRLGLYQKSDRSDNNVYELHSR